MAEKPPAWTETTGQIGQIPISITADVSSADVNPNAGQSAHLLAEQIIRQNQPIINRFVATQRQQIEIGGLDVHSSLLPLDRMDVHYSYVQGLERMHYHVTPEAEAPPELPQPAVPTPPKLPTPEGPPPIPEIETPEPEVPEPASPPEVEPPPEPPPEEKPPEAEKPPEEEKPPEQEEEKKPEYQTPDFLLIDIPCLLPVEFGAGAGDPV